MPGYRVASGEMDRIVHAAAAPDNAAAVAVRQEHESESLAALSTIIEVIEIADGPWLCDTETVCKAAGAWRDQSSAT